MPTINMLIIHVMKMPMAAIWYFHVCIFTVPSIGLNISGRIMTKKLIIIKEFKMDSHSRKYLKSSHFNSFYFECNMHPYFLLSSLVEEFRCLFYHVHDIE